VEHGYTSRGGNAVEHQYTDQHTAYKGYKTRNIKAGMQYTDQHTAYKGYKTRNIKAGMQWSTSALTSILHIKAIKHGI
jgi:hypothetical protein